MRSLRLICGLLLASAAAASGQELGVTYCWQSADSGNAHAVSYLDVRFFDPHAVINHVTQQEALAHEAVHRAQGDSAIKANGGNCPYWDRYTAVTMEVAAYCVSDAYDPDGLLAGHYRSFWRMVTQFNVPPNPDVYRALWDLFASRCNTVPKQMPDDISKYRDPN